ncbi:MAG: UDP-N-acetylenolpyruvoylglucosamine reductase [Candidatus Levybacteria bacterium CG10_big_fil_rev_8_21_14_0_10_36_7]|nr:MAG: UDP-N-acetylenolpyruvoylglucosamine reductase [Candidatus Levybacteria bacterium CG10_big_fil_rev_8_21_14_0_10_36_7]
MTVHRDFNLSEFLWYKIGGKTRFLIDVQNKQDLKDAFDFIKKEKVKNIFFLGFGSNLIFSDNYFDGVVIRFVVPKKEATILVKENVVEALAGVDLDDVIQFAFIHKLLGLEWAGGLPGTVGAAIRGNVGAFGGEIKDSVKEVEVAEIQGSKLKFKKLKRFELKFSYRDSLVKKKKMIVLSAQFRLKPTDFEGIRKANQTYLNNKEYRKRRHPLELPNCGSVFKNVTEKENVKKVLEIFPDIKDKVKRDWHGKVSMGYLIKRLDFSEFQIGQAQVSPKHCNFIVNLGGAKSSDVLAIIEKIQEKFQELFGFTPEVEPEIVS